MGILPLMKKDFLLSLVLFAVVVPGMAWYWLDTRDALDATVVVMQLTAMPAWSLFLIFNIELGENRSRGYRFIETLPVSRAGTAVAKLLASTLAVLSFALVSWWVFASLGAGESGTEAAPRLLLVATPLVLAVNALAYAGVFRFGFGVMSKVLVPALLAGYVSPVLIMEYLVEPGRLSLARVSVQIGWPAAAALSAAGIVIWLLSALAAVGARRKGYEK